MYKNQIVDKNLKLKNGDILIFEDPFEDMIRDDMIPFKSLDDFEPTHSAMWLNTTSRPIAHAVREGHKLPGLRLTNLWDARCVIFRHKKKELAEKAADIMKIWAEANKSYNKHEYNSSYPERYWKDRREKDLNKFNDDNRIIGPATIYPEPRATNDILDLTHNPQLANMGNEGLRRAIKFSSRRELTTPHSVSKGQRCTAILVAAFHAAIFSEIVKAEDNKIPFKQFKNTPFLQYADNVLVKGWQQTLLGKKILACLKDNCNWDEIFSHFLSLDQRYATPKTVYNQLKTDKNIEMIGYFSSFENEVCVYNACNKNLQIIDCNQISVNKTISMNSSSVMNKQNGQDTIQPPNASYPKILKSMGCYERKATNIETVANALWLASKKHDVNQIKTQFFLWFVNKYSENSEFVKNYRSDLENYITANYKI